MINNSVAEAWTYQTRGYLSTKVSSYTEEKERNMGQLSKAQIEQTTDFQSNLSSLLQLRWTSSSLDFDLSKKSNSNKKDNFSVYLGENYLKYKSENWVAQVGYQEVVWGEAFGFNYADIINPKDLKQTFFSDASESRLPLLLLNVKTFYNIGEVSGSFQLLYSPEPHYSKTLPIDIYVGNLFPTQTLSLIKDKNPNIFETSEIGGKITASYSGLDLGIFTYSYSDREPSYSLISATLSNISINEAHNRIKSSGFSFSKTLNDFVLRSDIVYTQDKKYNYVLNSQLKTFSTNSLNSLVSLDSPTYEQFAGVLVFADSSLSSIMSNSFRAKKEQFLILKISKNLESDKSLELSYIHEMDLKGHSLQTFLNWPINSSTDLKVGGEFYFGEELSHLNKLKNISSVFFSIKNYFQL